MTHKWDYERPGCLWEEWPWWLRWPIAVAIAIYFGGSVIAFMIGMAKVEKQVERARVEQVR